MAVTRFSGECRCRCGAVRLRVLAPPLTRYHCHCRICQRVYGRAYGDPTVVWGTQVEVEDRSRVAFRRQRIVPFAVRCGTCRSCAAPVVAYTRLLPGLDLALVPADLYRLGSDVPAAVGHLFYGSRAGDVADDLPRYGGFLASELGFARFVLAGLIRRRSAGAGSGSRSPRR